MGIFNKSSELLADFEELSRKQQIRIDELERIISNLNAELESKDSAFKATIAQVYNDEFKPMQDRINQLEHDNKVLKAAGKKVHETNKELTSLVDTLTDEIARLNSENEGLSSDNKTAEIIRLQKELDNCMKSKKVSISDDLLINVFNARYTIDDSIYYDYRELLEASKVLLEFYYEHRKSDKYNDDLEINSIFEDDTEEIIERQNDDINGQEMFLKRLNEIYKKH